MRLDIKSLKVRNKIRKKGTLVCMLNKLTDDISCHYVFVDTSVANSLHNICSVYVLYICQLRVSLYENNYDNFVSV